jgi:hypothetical protein
MPHQPPPSRPLDRAWPARASHHGPPPVAAVAAGAALALVAALGRGRRSLAAVVALALAVAAFEGAGHAAMHLGNVPHGDGMAIGASVGQPCAIAGPDQPAGGTPPASPDAIAEPVACQTTDTATAVYEGRAPPLA